MRRLHSVVVFLRDVRETTNRGVTLDEYLQPKFDRSNLEYILLSLVFKGQGGLVVSES